MKAPPPVTESQPSIATFHNSYASLPTTFFARVAPTPVREPRIIHVNRTLADRLGVRLDSTTASELAAIFSGNSLPAGSDPIAMAYAGHQFGNFVPQLGDGRAILIGEVLDSTGRRWDVQLKGSGRTPFSRAGDGRAALGPVLREYLVSEAMHALGIPTTRALAAVTTGEPVRRPAPTPGAILTRTATSHVRVGTFQYFAARGDSDGVRRLADYVIERLFPDLRDCDNPYLALLSAVTERQATLVARWLHIGFIHGVMNTDNTAVSGETLDFGPCAFMDAYDPAAVFSSIDRMGRYAYSNQPEIAQWNLARLAEALLPLLADSQESAIEAANQILVNFSETFEAHWLAGMRRKCGLMTAQHGDREFVQTLLDLMHGNQVDYTCLFRALTVASSSVDGDAEARALFRNPAAYDAWAAVWRARLAQDSVAPEARLNAMNHANPVLIPRNHRIEEVIVAAVERADYAPFERLLDAVSRPFVDEPHFADLRSPPLAHERVTQTFCGT